MTMTEDNTTTTTTCNSCNPCTKTQSLSSSPTSTTTTTTTNMEQLSPTNTDSLSRTTTAVADSISHHHGNNNEQQQQQQLNSGGGGSGGGGNVEEGLDAIDIFDIIRDVKDPEHPCTLEELNIISEDSITVTQSRNQGMKKHISITITPTVKHCSLVADIGLCIRTRLMRVYGEQTLNDYKIDIQVADGSHDNEQAVNRQINDKERVAAALENPLLMQLIDKCVEETGH